MSCVEASGRKEVFGELGIGRVDMEKEDGGLLKQGMRERRGGDLGGTEGWSGWRKGEKRSRR